MMIRSRRVAFFTCAVLLTSCEPVTGIVGDPVQIEWSNCAGANNGPVWFAVEDGTAGWNRIGVSGSSTFIFTLRSGKGGIALFDSQGLFVIYGTSAELKSLAPTCAGTPRDVAGAVMGYVPGDNIAIDMGSAGTDVSGSAASPAAFTLFDVEAGGIDLIAVKSRNSFTGGGTVQQRIPAGIAIRRGITASTTATLDFNSATEGGAPVQRTMTLVGANGGEAINITSSLITPTTEAEISFYFANLQVISGSHAAPFYGLPGTRLATGETHLLNVTTFRQTSSTITDSRFENFTFGDAVDQSVTLGAYLTNVTASRSPRPSATYTIQTGYDKIWNFFANQGSVAINVYMTSEYADVSSGNVTVGVPDLTGVSGFNPAWLLTPGTAATWGFVAADAPITAVINLPGPNRGAQRQDRFTP